MPIVEKKMYTCLCDNCKKDICEDHEYSCWCIDGIEDNIADSNWYISEQGNYYCSDCWSYGDNDEIIINTDRTKKP